jgi:hypothetical protein
MTGGEFWVLGLFVVWGYGFEARDRGRGAGVSGLWFEVRALN